MNDFTYQNTSRLIFGKGQNANIAEFIKPYSDTVFVVHYGEEITRQIARLESENRRLRAQLGE